MPKVGHVHNEAFQVDNHRLYNIGGARGINLVSIFPTGLGFGQVAVVIAAALVWTLPLSMLGVGFRNAGGLGTLLLLGPPVFVAIIASRKLSSDITPTQWLSFKTNYYLRQSRHLAGNAPFVPAQKTIIAEVFFPRTTDEETRR